MSVESLIQTGKLEKVALDPAGAISALEEARSHIASALVIKDNDPNGAFQLAYDAARKAVMSHMRGAGVRVRKGEGAHAIAALYAAAAIDADLGKRLDVMRRRRNRSEYGSAYFDEDDVQDATSVAAALVAAATV
jgi:hypothetical protein